MTNPTPSITDLELAEMEAWRIYQLHAVENNKLREKWRLAVINLSNEKRSAENQQPCTTA